MRGNHSLEAKEWFPPSATSIGAAVRCRFRRLFRLIRLTPCGLKAAPATDRPVVSLPLQESRLDKGRY